MTMIEEYVSRVEETCGQEKHILVFFKYESKDEAISKILKKANLQRSISGIIFDLSFENVSFRLYASGKAIFKGLKDEEETRRVLSDLLS